MTQADAANTATVSSAPALSELERARLINLELQLKLRRTQLEVLTLQFYETPQARALKDDIERLTAQINAAAADLFHAKGVDPDSFQLDVERGAFVARGDATGTRKG